MLKFLKRDKDSSRSSDTKVAHYKIVGDGIAELNIESLRNDTNFLNQLRYLNENINVEIPNSEETKI